MSDRTSEPRGPHDRHPRWWARLAALTAVALCLVGLGTTPAAALPAYPDVDDFTWFGNYRIDEVWKTGATGQGVVVAVLDTGVEPGRELSGVVRAGTDFAGGDGRRDTNSPRGHGTAMARFIAAQGGGPNGLTGIAPNSRILPVTINSNDAGATAQSYIQGIDWAAGHGAKVINISQGTDGTCPAAVQDAVTAAVKGGSIVVAAAGNTGNAGNSPEFPAACKGVLAVGSVYGDKRPWPKSQRQTYVDVAAPGVDMVDENLAGEAGKSSGTSNSAALVSASAALVWSKFPKLTNRQVVARLLASVTDDTARKGRDDVTGYGIVLPYRAITDTISASAPNPVFDELPRSTPSSAPASSAAPTASSAQPSAGTTSGPSPVADSDSGSSNTVWIVGGVVLALIVVGGIVAVVARSRRTGPPPAGSWPS